MMHTKNSWRRALAASAAVALVTGGVLFGATAANAAEDTLTVTSPTEGQTVESRTVVFTGTGSDGSTVNVLDEDGERIRGTEAAVVADGTWTTTGTYEETDAVEQTVYVNQVTGGSGAGEKKVSFMLPPAYGFAVLTPLDGSKAASRTVLFGGTGTDGATVEVLDEKGDRVAGTEAVVVADGIWATTGSYSDDAATEQTVVASQMIDGEVRGEQTVSFTLPEELLPTPVITSPTAGEALTGSAVTFSGTGTAGENVVLAVVPTALINELSTKAAPVPDDPEAPIIVGEDGRWSVTLALDPNDYTAVAVLVELSDDGSLITVRSDPSEPVQFTLAAAVAPTPPAQPASPASSGNGSKLAETGLGLDAAGVGGVLALAGVVLLVVRRRVRAS